MDTLQTNCIRCKKLAIIVLGLKNIPQTVRQAQVGKNECRKITATKFTTRIVATFLKFMIFFCKVFVIHKVYYTVWEDLLVFCIKNASGSSTSEYLLDHISLIRYISWIVKKSGSLKNESKWIFKKSFENRCSGMRYNYFSIRQYKIGKIYETYHSDLISLLIQL